MTITPDIERSVRVGYIILTERGGEQPYDRDTGPGPAPLRLDRRGGDLFDDAVDSGYPLGSRRSHPPA